MSKWTYWHIYRLYKYVKMNIEIFFHIFNKTVYMWNTRWLSVSDILVIVNFQIGQTIYTNIKRKQRLVKLDIEKQYFTFMKVAIVILFTRPKSGTQVYPICSGPYTLVRQCNYSSTSRIRSHGVLSISHVSQKVGWWMVWLHKLTLNQIATDD